MFILTNIFIFSSSFIVKDWGECSVPCGEGIRMREVKCQIFLEFSKTIANLPDDKCPGPKPVTTEICYAGLCDTRPSALKEKMSKEKITEKLPDAPTPQGLVANDKFQQDGLIKAMALQSSYGRSRGKSRNTLAFIHITNDYNTFLILVEIISLYRIPKRAECRRR